MSHANLFSAFRFNGQLVLKAGIKIDLREVEGGVQRTLIMGPRFGRDARKRIIVPVDFHSEPVFGRGGDLAFKGSFAVDAGGQPRLTAFSEEPGTCYVLARTGFDPNRSVMTELGDMQRASGKPEPIKLVAHGSFALSAGPDTVKVLGLGEDASATEAEEVWKVIGWKPGLRVPPYTLALWRIRNNAGVLIRDINGGKLLVVGEKDTARADAADGLDPLFDTLLEGSRAA